MSELSDQVKAAPQHYQNDETLLALCAEIDALEGPDKGIPAGSKVCPICHGWGFFGSDTPGSCGAWYPCRECSGMGHVSY
jgi:hypothetical protein